MTLENSLRGILERWKEAFDQYSQLKAMTEPAIIRWEWTEGERYSLLPYYFQRFPGRARALKEAPTSRGYYIRYGFDEQNRPRVHRFYDYLDLHGQERLRQDRIRGFEGVDVSETFYSYGDTLAEIIEFSIPPRIPLKIQQIFYENEKVTRHVSFRLNGYTPLYSEKGEDPDELYEWLGPNGRIKKVEDYVYDGDRLVKILTYGEWPGAGNFTTEERFTYDEAGPLLRIEEFHESGSRRVLYRKRPKGQTFKSIRETAVQKMIAAIIQRLRAENIQEKLYCIELAYESAIRHFPPYIIPGLESFRQSLTNSSDSNDLNYVFAPIVQGDYLEITHPETLEICGLLEQEVQAGQKWDSATRILREVAAALNRYDWNGILDVTRDFVVYAIDDEIEADKIEDVLRTSASQEQILEWKRKGWL